MISLNIRVFTVFDQPLAKEKKLLKVTTNKINIYFPLYLRGSLKL